MDAHTVLDEWEPTPFDGGLEAAAGLADRGFDGAIRAGRNWLFIADGAAVAVVADLDEDPSVGDLDAFEDADGEAFEAPHPGVARLAPMLALGGEVRGQYFSDDTPVGTVEETLTEGEFTGYVELAENVLSGDYYVVFDEGRPAYVAFIGSTQQLATDEEAERKTKNEVGIYTVTAVTLPDIELPDPPEDADPVGAVGADSDAGATPDTGVDSTGTGTDAGVGRDADPAVSPESDPATEADADPSDDATDAAVTTDADAEPTDAEAPDAGGEIGVGATDADSIGTDDAGTDPTGSSLDTGQAGRSDDSDADIGTSSGSISNLGSSTADDSGDDAGDGSEGTSTGAAGAGAAGEATGRGDDAGRGGLGPELAELKSTVERLEERVARLEAAGGDDAGPAVRTDGPSLSPAEALAQTTLFVREGTRGGATLEDAHAGHTDREALARNLDLEWHTRFEDAGATVDGQPFAAFLESSQAYEFVEWLTTNLLFEIRVTDNADSLSKLYDAIPEVDRVFFDETVTVETGGDTVELTFDVVVRDQSGAPLFVATLDERRDPTPSSTIEALVTDASDFCAANGTLVGAFAVSDSYFDPEALEVAQEATTSSLLSRQKHRSFVNLTRKNGFHLCLVEAREAAFHLTLPEL